jgi:hypothetical protein
MSEEKKGGLSNLSEDSLVKLAEFLTPSDLLALGSTNRFFKNACKQDSIWHQKIGQYFPKVPAYDLLENIGNAQSIFKSFWSGESLLDDLKKLPAEYRTGAFLLNQLDRLDPRIVKKVIRVLEKEKLLGQFIKTDYENTCFEHFLTRIRNNVTSRHFLSS